MIPQFKKEKLEIYHKLISQFSVIEINNAHSIAKFWNKIVQNPNIKGMANQSK
jgi:hypothetical protein